MPNQPLHPEAKPIDGDVIILCEGDAVGYESQLLKMWADKNTRSGRFVRVLACGTSDGIYGMADAVGRTIPVIAVEDRDFRTADEATADCEKKRKNRENRSVAMRGWLSWNRAEIENYFVDDAVLPDVFAKVFECTPDAVRDAIRSALSNLVVSQALEYALYRARRSWVSKDANRELRVETFEWSENGQKPLEAAAVRKKLESRLKSWKKTLSAASGDGEHVDNHPLLNDFDEKYCTWSGMTYESDDWRCKWACKEVLKHVRMTLASAKGGWWSHEKAPAAGVPWEKLGDGRARDAHDRTIERKAQPYLVAAVSSRITRDATFDMRLQLDRLANLIAAI